jgi:hypothetical protein
MLESITCLIETVKKKCNPVLRNAQTDRSDDRSDHLTRGPPTAVHPLLFRQISESAKNVSFGRLRRTVPPAPNAIKHAFPTANKLAI